MFSAFRPRQFIWSFLHRNRWAFSIVTKDAGHYRIFEEGNVADSFETTRIYRDGFVWAWRRPLLATTMITIAFVVILSVVMNWPQIAARFGALLVAVGLLNGLNPAVFVAGSQVMAARFGSATSHLELSVFSRKFEIWLSLIGTIAWAFGDWLVCSIHSWSLSTCSS